MVGYSGQLAATKTAVEIVDNQLGRVIEQAKKMRKSFSYGRSW